MLLKRELILFLDVWSVTGQSGLFRKIRFGTGCQTKHASIIGVLKCARIVKKYIGKDLIIRSLRFLLIACGENDSWIDMEEGSLCV